MNANDILDAIAAGESADWEFKSAKGGIPASVWETYSAMANTNGGVIVLGIKEIDNGQFEVQGLDDPIKTEKDFWNTINNRGNVSANLLANSDAHLEPIEGKTLLVVQVPRATRRQRPVFVGQNPLDGTFRRYNDGDYKCPTEDVGRMLADQSQEPSDSRILENFTVADLDGETIRQYRNRFSARNPNHVWLNEDTQGFLQKLGGWAKSRTTGEEGLTVAGLLMFGSDDALKDVAAGLKYHIDYRERPTNSIADRWTDRLTPDGTWVPNLFQFFQKVYPKLTTGLKLPFVYVSKPPDLFTDPVRSGQSPVHEAIQEALVNALIHADYRGMGGVVIERFVDRMELSNPGTLLVSIEQLRQGAVSECRNPSLQKMFQLIGAGDKAGSGIDKIRSGWDSQKWRWPLIEEQLKPDRVRFILPMVSLISPESEARLLRLFGDDYASLTPIEVQTLVTADLEGEVSNSRLQLVRNEHSVELTKMLQGLTSRGFLEQVGLKRGSSYRLPSWASPLPTGASPLTAGTPPLTAGTPHLTAGTPPLTAGTPPLTAGTPPLVGGASITDDPQLLEIARLAREKPRLMPGRVKQIVRELCRDRFLTSGEIGTLMNRGPEKLREKFLSSMVASGELSLRYPDEPNHPDQAYTIKD